MIEREVEILARPIQEEANPFITFLVRFGPAILIIGFYIWFYRRMTGGGGRGVGGAMMGMGKSKAKRFDQETDKKVTFEDVAGIDEAENELVEIVDFLKTTGSFDTNVQIAEEGWWYGRWDKEEDYNNSEIRANYVFSSVKDLIELI